jgi:N-succinyldiaminopimelate aminotransferase
MESARVTSFGTSVFSEISALAKKLDAVNLGQGFPNFDGPKEVAQAAIEAIVGGHNQYAPSQGSSALREAVAAHAARFYRQQLDPELEVGVTCGATEALFAAMQAFTAPSDEVILFEPFYDAYLAAAQMAQVTAKIVPLRAPNSSHATWWFDADELAAAFSERTKLVIVNTPHNPTGKVFNEDELRLIGTLTRKHRALMLTDEVYEHLVFSGAKHVRAATLDDFSDFTLTISSGGKSFSYTGWKIGWYFGPAKLVRAVQKAHQWMTFCVPEPLQLGIAKALALSDSYFQTFTADYARKRDTLRAALQSARFDVLPCEGTYFLMAATDAHRRREEDDVSFCRRMLLDCGVAAIPPSVFFTPANRSAAKSLIRFAFCKTDSVLEDAARRLKTL